MREKKAYKMDLDETECMYFLIKDKEFLEKNNEILGKDSKIIIIIIKN